MAVDGVYFGNVIYPKNPGIYHPENEAYERMKKIKNNPYVKPDRPGYKPNGEKIDPEVRQKQLEAIKKALAEKGRIDPTKDKVFIDPKTGELTTIKPGLIDPKAEEKRAEAGKRAAGLLGLIGAGVLAFLFRGKIKGGVAKFIKAAKPFIKNLLAKGKGLVQKGIGFVKPAITKAKNFVKPVLTKIAEVAVKAKNALLAIFKKAPKVAV